MAQDKESSDNSAANEKEILAMTNKFIAMANRMANTEKKEIWRVSAAFRYGAARFSCHEAAAHSENLAEEHEKLVKWFSAQFKEMLDDNMQQFLDSQ